MSKFNSLLAKTALAVCLFSASAAQATNLCGAVFNGTVERLRVQQQSSGDTVVRLYLYPGNNAYYAGYTSSEFMVNLLMKAKDSQTEITGYADSQCKIQWVDLK